MMKSRKVAWAGHVVRVESTKTEYEFFGGEKVKGRNCWKS